jgi:hypothetical protein
MHQKQNRHKEKEIDQNDEAVCQGHRQELPLLQMSFKLSVSYKAFASHRLYAFQEKAGGEIREGKTPGNPNPGIWDILNDFRSF